MNFGNANNVNKYIGKEIHLNNQKKCLKICFRDQLRIT